MNSVITIPETDLVAVLGENGEHWVKHAWDNNGSVGLGLHSAIRLCQPRPGDAYLVEQVARRHGWGPAWNDAKSTTWPMVRERLAHIEVSDRDLADTFGPQWEHIVALVRRAAVLTADEAERLDAAWTAARNVYRDADRDAVQLAVGDVTQDAGRTAARSAAWDATLNAVKPAAWDGARPAAWDAARDAAEALVIRDLIGQRGFTQAHYDLLTGPWVTAIGPVHPDDHIAAVAH